MGQEQRERESVTGQCTWNSWQYDRTLGQDNGENPITGKSNVGTGCGTGKLGRNSGTIIVGRWAKQLNENSYARETEMDRGTG